MAERGWARHALSIGVFEFRRSVRAMWREKIRLALLVAGMLMPTLVGVVFVVVFADAIRGVGSLPVVDQLRGMIALFWLFVVFMIGQRTVSARPRIEAEPLMLTTMSARTVAGGLLVAETLRILASLLIPLLVLLSVSVFLLGSVASLIVAPTVAVLFTATAVVTGSACGYAVAWIVATSPFVARHKTVLGTVVVLIGMAGYSVFTVAAPFGAIDQAVFAWLPVGWLIDLAVVGTPFVGSSLHAVGGTLSCVAIAAVGGAIIERETVALWFTEPVSVDPTDEADASSDGASTSARRDALAAAVSPLVVPRVLGQPTRRVAEWVLLRTRRDPNRLTFVLIPLITIVGPLVGPGAQLGSLAALVPLSAVGLPWLAGSLFAMNPLGDEGSVLPVTLTAVSGTQYVRGLLVPGLLLGLPIGVVVTAVLGVVSPYTPAEQVGLVVLCAYLTCVSVTITPAVGMILPRFSAISVGQSQDVLPPRMSAVAVHAVLTVLPGGLLAALVVAPSVARTVVSGLVGFVPGFLLELLSGSDGGLLATAAGWFIHVGNELQAADLGLIRVGAGGILLIGGIVVVILLYRNAVHRFQRYNPQ